MSMRDDVLKLAAITQLVQDDRLNRLRIANEARAKSLMQLAALAADEAPSDLPVIPAGLVGLAYQCWADIRRADLNVVIARQTVEVMEARAAASLAFGRAQAIHGVAERLKR
jgi:hypothetical protein